MGDREPATDAEAIEPEEAFLLLAHEIRIRILLALWEARESTLAFSELYERTGVDDSAHFNYHLSKLVGRFVDRTDEGYELLYAGHRVVDAIQSGVLHTQVDLRPVELDEDCPRCGSPLVFEYGGHVASIACPDCDATVLEYPFDPGGVRDRSGAAVADAFDRRTRHTWRLADEGVCPSCSGTVEGTLVPDAGDGDDHYAADHPFVAHFDCRQCSFFSYVPVGAVALFEPAVEHFLRGRGVAVRETPLWGLDFALTDDRLEVLSADPAAVAVTVSAGGEELRVEVDDALAIHPIDRSSSDRN